MRSRLWGISLGFWEQTQETDFSAGSTTVGNTLNPGAFGQCHNRGSTIFQLAPSLLTFITVHSLQQEFSHWWSGGRELRPQIDRLCLDVDLSTNCNSIACTQSMGHCTFELDSIGGRGGKAENKCSIECMTALFMTRDIIFIWFQWHWGFFFSCLLSVQTW